MTSILEAIASAITDKTRLVIVNTPNNPTGRIYPESTLKALAEILNEASARIGQRIFILADETYYRVVFDGNEFYSPAAYYPYTLINYSYAKALLAPGQRMGYIAISASMPERQRFNMAFSVLQRTYGYVFSLGSYATCNRRYRTSLN